MSTPTITRNVGAGIERVDGTAKVSGEALYAFEYRIPNAAYAVPVLSTIARGRVISVDPAAALDEPGVLAVIDSRSAPRLERGGRASDLSPDLFVLQSDEVAYRGQIVAAVVATTLEAAREAAALVGVAYDEQPHDVVLRADHPELYTPKMANAGVPGLDQSGDVEAGLRAAAATVKATYTTATEHHNPMEPHAAIAVWEDDGLTLYDANQGPFFTAQMVASLFGMATEQIRIVSDYIGGGFGSKALARPPAVLAAMAAKVMDRPVKVALTRQQMFSLVSYRPPSIQHLRLGAGIDGRLTAIDHTAITQTSRIEEYVDQIGASTRVVYGSANWRVEHKIVRLDVPTPGFMRGPGHATGMFALESALDELADELGMDPVALRIANDTDVEPHSGLEFSSRSLVECLREGAERFDWARRDPTPGVRRDGRWLVGTGVASAHHPDYIRPSVAHAHAHQDGSFAVEVSASDIGTGARTALLQVAADALGVEMGRVALTIGGNFGPSALAGGSMGTSSWSWAVDKVCRALLDELQAHGGAVPPGGLSVTADTSEDIEAREKLARHTFGAQYVQVRVDAATGEVRVDRMLGVFAAGTIVNARTARSQFYGGMIMGLGQALLERTEIDPVHGDFANHDLASYHFAANADVPTLEVVMLDETDRTNHPVAPKGIGELSMIGAAAAIANALHHATGHRFRDLPIRIEDVRRALAVDR
jgi:xanthine dehydrogenase YagR molybdenum-binding subunit